MVQVRDKGDYSRTKASDFKHHPALNLSIFFVNVQGVCLIQLYRLKNINLEYSIKNTQVHLLWFVKITFILVRL